jgi:hypothetical protein
MLTSILDINIEWISPKEKIVQSLDWDQDSHVEITMTSLQLWNSQLFSEAL